MDNMNEDRLHQLKVDAYKSISKRKGFNEHEERTLGIHLALSRVGVKIDLRKEYGIYSVVSASIASVFDKIGEIDEFILHRMRTLIFHCSSSRAIDTSNKGLVAHYVVADTGLKFCDVIDCFEIFNNEFFDLFFRAVLGHKLVIINNGESKELNSIVETGVKTKTLMEVVDADTYTRILTRELTTSSIIIYKHRMYATNLGFVLSGLPFEQRLAYKVKTFLSGIFGTRGMVYGKDI